jgi:FKBP-type peptidyl-prolyl cis-trans isomerase FkpA
MAAHAQTPQTREQLQHEWDNEQKAFLLANLQKPDWKATPSGLQYKRVLANETGAKVDPNGKVRMTYVTGLTMGITEGAVDPIEVPVSAMMTGMQQGLSMMRVGEIWEFVIPPIMAFGDKQTLGPDGKIMAPANSVILWRVQLVGVSK